MKMLKKMFLIVGFVGLMSSAAHATEVKGFRSALFGQNEAQVMQAVQKDLRVTAKQIEKNVDKVAGVEVLSVKLAQFEPLNLPAEVNYILGHNCKCLTQVIVNWNFPKGANEETRAEAMQGVAALVGHFAKGPWDKDAVTSNRLLNEAKEGQDSTIVFFRGQNPSGSAVTVLAAPVKMIRSKDKAQAAKGELVANVDAITQVSLSYEKDSRKPDVKKIDLSGF